MFLTKATQVFCVFWYILLSSWGLQDSDEDIILNADAAIRNTIDNLFLQLNLERNCLKLRQTFLIHNFFTNVSLMTDNTFKLIVTLSRVDKSKISEISTFVLNEILYAHQNQTEVEERSENSTGDFDDLQEFNNSINFENYDSFEILNEINSILHSDSSNENNTSCAQQDLKTKTTKNINFFSQEEWSELGPERRIYKGENAKIKYFPFMASIHMFNQFQCGGSIIQSDLILTAASCLQIAWDHHFYLKNPSFLSVRVGTKYFNRGGEKVPVLGIIFHPDYKPKNLANNIAILKLRNHLMFKNYTLLKIEIDRDEAPLSMSTKNFTIVGWGAKRPGNILVDYWSNRLSYAVLEIYDIEECEVIYSKEYVTENNFCAGYISRGSGACSRDVGDPGVINGILIGVTSFGASVCGTPDAPTVFTKVSHYANWIKSIMEQENPKSHEDSALPDPEASNPITSFEKDLDSTEISSTIMEPVSDTEKKHKKPFKDLRNTVYKRYLQFVFR